MRVNTYSVYRNRRTIRYAFVRSLVAGTSSRNGGLARTTNGAGGQRTPPQAPLRGHQKVAPAPPQIPHMSRTPTPQHTASSSRTHTPSPQNNKCGNGLWSVGSVPRRVKKLSWDDEADVYQKGVSSLKALRCPLCASINAIISVLFLLADSTKSRSLRHSAGERYENLRSYESNRVLLRNERRMYNRYTKQRNYCPAPMEFKLLLLFFCFFLGMTIDESQTK